MAEKIDISILFNPTKEETWLYKEYKKQSMAQQTAVGWLIEQLQAPCRGIPSHVIEKAKQMEKEQIIRARQDGLDNGFTNGNWHSNLYYNETYNK